MCTEDGQPWYKVLSEIVKHVEKEATGVLNDITELFERILAMWVNS